MQRGQRQLVTAAVCGGALAALSCLVKAHPVIGVDERIRAAARPHWVWGPAQLRADWVVENFRPSLLVAYFAVVVVILAVRCRSWRPVLVAAAGEALTGAVVTAVKTLVARGDPLQGAAAAGSSFPSGHTAQMLVVTGLIATFLPAGPARRLGWLLCALCTLTMGACLVLETAHWASDVVGGALAGGLVLSCVAAVRARYDDRRARLTR